MASLNKVQIIGSIGKDPDIRTTQNGNKIGSFSVACSESWKDKNTGEKKEKTEWVKVVVFNDRLVSVVENYVKKGGKVYIEGQLQTRKWQGDDGRDNYSTEVVLQQYRGEIILLSDKKPDAQQQATPAANPNHYGSNVGGHYGADGQWIADPQAPANDPLDDDIPF